MANEGCGFVQVPVGPPSEVEEIFDTISYAKGSCVIRMLHDWIGTEVGGWLAGMGMGWNMLHILLMTNHAACSTVYGACTTTWPVA